jgi:choline-sulfatase
MIQFTDRLVGRLLTAFNKSLQHNAHKGLSLYLSDHGDQAGEKNLFGKQTFYEGSVHIPLIFTGEGIKSGKVIPDPVSILDICPTLCEIAGADVPDCDGESLFGILMLDEKKAGRYIISEFVEDLPEGLTLGRMIVRNTWKWISYSGWEEFDELYDLSTDPAEQKDVAAIRHDIIGRLKEKFPTIADETVIKRYQQNRKYIKIIEDWTKKCSPQDPDRWIITANRLNEAQKTKRMD